METEQSLNSKIITVIMQIVEKYPELSKFLNEMPITIPTISKPRIKRTDLKEYYQSLESILTQYKLSHSAN